MSPSPRPRRRSGNKAAPTQPAAATAVSAGTEAVAQPLFRVTIGVRWRDLDAFNHVNNSVFLTYLEEARLQWLKGVPGPWFDAHAMPVLAASALNYRRPIEWPAQLLIELRCTRLGSSSLTLAHRIGDAEASDRLYADGEVTLVWMDPASGRSVPLPQAIRDACG